MQFFDVEDVGRVAFVDDVVKVEFESGEIGGFGDALGEVDD